MPELLVNADPPRAGSFRSQEKAVFHRPAWRRMKNRSRRKLPPLGHAAPPRVRGNRLPHSAGWLASLLLHGAVLVLGASLLVRSAHFEVFSGKTSTELVLLAANPPAAAKSPAPPDRTIAPPPPAPLAQPVLPPVALAKPPSISPPVLSPVATKTPAPTTELQPRTAIARIAAHPAPATSAAARGAIEARPDDGRNAPPVYPEDSRAACEQGVVMLRVDVSAAGAARRVAILKSSGYFRLDQAAREAVRAWRFHPALLGGAPVSSEVDVPVRFELQ